MFFIENELIYHKIHPFKDFSVFPKICNYHQSILEYFHYPQRNLIYLRHYPPILP